MVKRSKPQLPAQLEVGKDVQFWPEASLQGAHFLGADISGLAAQNVSVDECSLEKVHAVQAKMEKAQFTDTLLKKVDFSGARCSEGSFIRIEASNSRFAGWDISKGVIKDALFADCKLDMANFRFAKLTRVKFVGCSFFEADFQAAELRQVEFSDCILEKTEFANCTLKDVDLRTSQLLDIGGWTSLTHAKVDMAQLVAIAPQLAMALGLVVEE